MQKKKTTNIKSVLKRVADLNEQLGCYFGENYYSELTKILTSISNTEFKVAPLVNNIVISDKPDSEKIEALREIVNRFYAGQKAFVPKEIAEEFKDSEAVSKFI